MGTQGVFDLGVAGGGIIGLTTALIAARKGGRVLVVDESRPLEAATPASAGVIWPLEELAEDSSFWPWVHKGVHAYPGFVQSLAGVDAQDIEFASHGLLRIDGTRECLRPGEELITTGYFNAKPALRGAWAPRAKRVSPAKLQQVLLDASQDAGVTVVEGSLECLPEAQDWSTTAGGFQCKRGVMATGAWSISGLETAEPLLPVRGQMLELQLAEPWSGPMLQDGDSYMVPVAPDRVILGSTVELVGFDASPTDAGREQILREGRRILSVLGSYAITAHWAGLRPRMGQGHAPLIGRLEQHAHIACALGLYRLGVTTAPAVGEALANWAIQGGELPLIGV